MIYDARITEYEEALNAIEENAEKLFQMGRTFRPMFPWVFVYVLQKERTQGSIVLPADQNKPMHEGIVLATWDAFVKQTSKGNPEIMKSELCPGDHVLLHHWAGHPISNYDAKRFRLVRELDWHETTQGGIVGKIDYHAFTQQEALTSLLDHIDGDWTGGAAAVARAVLERYILVDKQTKAVTLSGV